MHTLPGLVATSDEFHERQFSRIEMHGTDHSWNCIKKIWKYQKITEIQYISSNLHCMQGPASVCEDCDDAAAVSCIIIGRIVALARLPCVCLGACISCAFPLHFQLAF
jgi:hypothetical protein